MRTHRAHLLTSNYVFDDTLTLVRHRLGWRVAHRLGERLRDGRLTRLERVPEAFLESCCKNVCKMLPDEEAHSGRRAKYRLLGEEL